MDTELLVDDQIDDGRRLIDELVRAGFDVTVAFWGRTYELWFLYVASASLDGQDLGNAYRQVYACLRQIPNAWIDLSRVKVIPAGSPMAREAMAIRDKGAARIPTKYRGPRLGEFLIEEAYIYPRAQGLMTRDVVIQTVAALMNRTGAVQPSVVTLTDGSTFNAIPVGIRASSSGPVDIVFRDTATNADRILKADDIANIQ